MTAVSPDVRERAIALVRDEDMTFTQVAAELGVSASTVSRWAQAAGIEVGPAARACERCEQIFRPRSMNANHQRFCPPCGEARSRSWSSDRPSKSPSSNGAPRQTASSNGNGHLDDDLPGIDFDLSGLTDDEIELIGANLPRGVKHKWLARVRCEVPDDETIIARYGPLLEEFYQAMRLDPSYLIEMVSYATQVEAAREYGRNSPEHWDVKEALRQRLPEVGAEWVGRRVAVVHSPYT